LRTLGFVCAVITLRSFNENGKRKTTCGDFQKIKTG
jgi:hypothetical protein